MNHVDRVVPDNGPQKQKMNDKKPGVWIAFENYEKGLALAFEDDGREAYAYLCDEN